jgi:hypothetical protein
MHRKDENSYKILIQKPEGKSLFGRPRQRWEHNAEIDLKEIRWAVWTGFI